MKAEEHPTPYYIWRTRGDGKVRSSHAANNGKVFSWDFPPPTGHPGEEYGCRCWAESFYDDGFIERERINPSYFIEDLIGLFSGGSLLTGLLSTLLRQVRDVDAETLSETQAYNLRRFDKKLPKAAGEIQIIKGRNGIRIFRSDVPARNIPNSFARYEKIVDAEGNTLSYTKTTFAPNGDVVHIKIK